MAIYHLHVDIVSRKTGRSAVAAAAYRSADKLRNEHDGLTHDYSEKSNSVNASAYQSGEKLQNNQINKTFDFTQKRGVVHSEIMLPKNAPSEYLDRSTLWNAVEKSEKRKDAQTARDIDMALPIELNRQEQIEIVREFIQGNYIDKGMCADFSIHSGQIHSRKGEVYPFQGLTIQKDNPHAHILLTTRNVTEFGFGNKNREWNNRELIKTWRENWANICNEKLKEKGLQERIDHRTLKAQGIDREPTITMGVEAWNLEKKRIKTERGNINRGIFARNKAKNPERIAERMHELKETHIILEKEITTLKQTASEANREMNVARIKAEEICERAEHIKTMKNHIDELKTERQNMGLFKRKKDIDSQITQLENSYIQAIKYFKEKYKIETTQAEIEINRLENVVRSKIHLHEKLQQKIAPLNEQRVLNIYEYHKQKLLVEIRSDNDKQRINGQLYELEKSSRVYKNLIKDDLLRIKCERQLNIINERNFEKIIKELNSEQGERLVKLRERERIIEHEQIRYR